jgi:uncharacterized protein
MNQLGNIQLDKVLEPRDAIAFELKKGTTFRIIDMEGQQVADLIAFDMHNFVDKISIPNTILINKTIYLTKGHTLYSTHSEPLLRIVEDTCGKHDLLAGSCSEGSNFFRYGVHGTPSCRSNFTRVLESYGITEDSMPYSLNVFMNVPVMEDGTTLIKEPISKPGDYIDFIAEKDCLIAISNCPQERNPCNAFNPTKLRVIVEAIN